MKIAMIGQKGIPAIYGGVERHVEDLATELANKGHVVLVYARGWYTPKNIKKCGKILVVHTASIHTKHLDTITHVFTATLHAIWHKADVFHYHGIGPSLLSWLPRLFCRNATVVVTCHSLDRHQQKWGWFAKVMLRLAEKTAYLFSHQTIAVSKTMQNYYADEFGKSITYIPNGVNIITRPIGHSLIEDKWNMKPNKYVLMVARLIKDKGTHLLIDGWQSAQQLFPELMSGLTLVITGDTDDGDYKKMLKQKARGDKSIIFTGWQKGQVLDELYANTLLFVHPSEREGLPLAVLQAMAHGKPALVSDIPGHKEAIIDCRFWFDNGSVSSLADKLVKSISDKQLLEKAGEANKLAAKERYDWKKITTKTLYLYSSNKGKVEKKCLCAART